MAVIQTAPGGQPAQPSPGGGGGTSYSNNNQTNYSPGGGGASSGGGGGGGGGGGYGSQAWYNRQQARARNKYLAQAQTIQEQIDALRLALGPKGFKKALDQKLRNVGQIQRISDRDLRRGYRERVGGLEANAEDNEKAAAGQGFANLANRSRERNNAISEAMAQGAGESDLLRAQEMSLRSWNANASEVNRSFYDSLTSINNSLTDLTVDTRTGRINNVIEANADREQLWTEYYGQRGETLTALGNALGLQAEYYGLAQEAGGGKKAGGKRKASAKKSGAAFDQASRVAGMAWDNPGVRQGLRKWEGADEFEGRQNNARYVQTDAAPSMARPEGSTLRAWEQ